MMALGGLNAMVPSSWKYLRYWWNVVNFSSTRITFDRLFAATTICDCNNTEVTGKLIMQTKTWMDYTTFARHLTSTSTWFLCKSMHHLSNLATNHYLWYINGSILVEAGIVSSWCGLINLHYLGYLGWRPFGAMSNSRLTCIYDIIMPDSTFPQIHILTLWFECACNSADNYGHDIHGVVFLCLS